jgi:hypothetical protein
MAYINGSRRHQSNIHERQYPGRIESPRVMGKERDCPTPCSPEVDATLPGPEFSPTQLTWAEAVRVSLGLEKS